MGIDTVTTATAGYFRFGALPEYVCGVTSDFIAERRSTNHAQGEREDGVSVYEGWETSEGVILDLRGVDTVSAIFIIGDPLYRVEGQRVVASDYYRATGADGEPLLYDDGETVTITATRCDRPVIGYVA